MIRTAQVLLRALGYRPSLLGSLDERTKVAVREFQRAESLDADGRISAYLILRLAEKAATKCE
ncbi:MAG TPA: peptidoglycan-binding domain-containing protein [Thermoanaerobaculia bacterium]